MQTGQLVFAQIMRYLPLVAFARMVKRRRAQHKVQEFTCLDQFLALAFAQLTGRESRRDIEINLRARGKHLYRLGFRCKTIARNTLANANGTRPWEVFADLAQHLIGIARPLYADDPVGTEFKALMGATVYALDSTTIDHCLSLFTWAPFRSTKAAIKLHTLIDLRGSIPSFIHISHGKMHDVRVLDLLAEQGLLEAGAYYVMDKAYVDFARLYRLNTARAFFVTRAKDNLQFQTVRRKAVNTLTGLISDHQVRLTGAVSCQRYPDILRRVVYFDEDTGKTFEFLTNNLSLPALTICALYRQRWQVELCFKWIKQHLRIKSFFGTSENAVKTQMGRHFHQCADRNREEKAALGSFPARNLARAEPEHVRNHSNTQLAQALIRTRYTAHHSNPGKLVPNGGTLVIQVRKSPFARITAISTYLPPW